MAAQHWPTRGSASHSAVWYYWSGSAAYPQQLCGRRRGNFAQFEEMYEQKRKEVNKVAEKFEKQMKAAKRSGNKVNQVLCLAPRSKWLSAFAAAAVSCVARTGLHLARAHQVAAPGHVAGLLL